MHFYTKENEQHTKVTAVRETYKGGDDVQIWSSMLKDVCALCCAMWICQWQTQ